jgi:wobble nucleotide-excising tRNase
MMTHRCNGSRKAGIAIRYGKDCFNRNAWRIWAPIRDDEWITTRLESIAEIRFCPFCGQELDVPEGENKR